MASNPDDYPPLTFEEALAEIEGIVRVLEQGQMGLQESMDQYTRAVKRLKDCFGELTQAERQIELLSGFDADGNPVTAPISTVVDEDLTTKHKARAKKRSASPDAAAKRRNPPEPSSPSPPLASFLDGEDDDEDAGIQPRGLF